MGPGGSRAAEVQGSEPKWRNLYASETLMIDS